MGSIGEVRRGGGNGYDVRLAIRVDPINPIHSPAMVDSTPDRLGQVVYAHVPLSPSSRIWYR